MAQTASVRDVARRLRFAIFAALTVVSVRPAGAYVQTITDRMTPVHWPPAGVFLIVHTALPPPNLTPELVLSAAKAAAATWSTPAVSCTSWVLNIVGEATADAPTANDQRNNLVFRKVDWTYDPAALAITTVFAQQADGVVLDADVEVNATPGRFRWGDLVAGVGTEGGAEDLQNTLTHEFGHLLGLSHNCVFPGDPTRSLDNAGNPVPRCDQASPQIQEATMFAGVPRGDVLRRTLAADDVAGVCAIYPASCAASCLADAAAPLDGASDSLPGEMNGDDGGPDDQSALLDSPPDQDGPTDTPALDQSAPVDSHPSGHEGCSCGVGGRLGSSGWVWLGLLAFALSWRARRRRSAR